MARAGLWSSLWAYLITYEDQPEPEFHLRLVVPVGQWHVNDTRPSPAHQRTGNQREPLTCALSKERVTGIEPALSAWELDCQASADLSVAGQPPCSLPLSTRWLPLLTLPSGTRRARAAFYDRSFILVLARTQHGAYVYLQNLNLQDMPPLRFGVLVPRP